MRLPIEKIGEVLAAWVDAELMPKASGLQKVGTVMASLALARRAPKIAESYAPALRMLGVLDEAGGIELDALRSLAAEAFAKTGKVTVAGVIIGQEDIQTIYETAVRFANG